MFYSLNDYFRDAIKCLDEILKSKSCDKIYFLCQNKQHEIEYTSNALPVKLHRMGKPINTDITGYMVYHLHHPIRRPETYDPIKSFNKTKKT